MKVKLIVFGVCALLAVSQAYAAQASRMTDESVEKLMEQVEKDVELFTKSIDSEYRNATIRSASGEVNIESFLKDFKEDAEKMRGRFDSKYSASAEVDTFLKRAQGIDARSASGANLFGAEAEWPRLKGSSGQLAQQYGVDFASNPASWRTRRMNDDELENVLESFEDNTKLFKKQLADASKKNDSISKAEREAALGNVDRMKDAAEDLRKAIDKQTDPSGSLALLNSVAGEIHGFVSKYGLAGAVTSSWGALSEGLSTVRSAF